MNIEYTTEGNGYVYEQNIEPGAIIETPVVVKLKTKYWGDSMNEETNERSKIIYTLLIMLICIVLGIYLGTTFIK